MKQLQNGSTSVEMAFVSLFFMILLIAVIDVGRAMYTWNALTEATRLGARAAAVCQVQDNIISTIATFNGNGLLKDISEEHINVNYLDDDGAVIANPTPANVWGFMQIRFVQVSIQGAQYPFLIPGLGSITLPPFTTTLPRESLGIVPNEASGC